MSVPSEVERLIDEIIQTEDSDTLNPKFSHLVKQLLNGELKYNIFAKMYPDHACYDMFVRLENLGSYAEYLKHPSKYAGTWCGGQYGAEVVVYSGRGNLKSCITEGECRLRQPGDKLLGETRLKSILKAEGRERQSCGCLAIYLSYLNHAGFLWIDKRRGEIDRFDPYYPGVPKTQEQTLVDRALRGFFGELLPNLKYVGNVQSEAECVQLIRSRVRRHSDNFCQDYGILYSIRRIHGMTNLEAAQDMVEMKSFILEDVRQLLRQMWRMEHLPLPS